MSWFLGSYRGLDRMIAAVGYARSRLHITRFGATPGGRLGDLVADHIGTEARVISESIYHSTSHHSADVISPGDRAGTNCTTNRNRRPGADFAVVGAK
jgi:hypothetical protein